MDFVLNSVYFINSFYVVGKIYTDEYSRLVKTSFISIISIRFYSFTIISIYEIILTSMP